MDATHQGRLSLMTGAPGKHPPIELLEESLQILRSTGAPLLLKYWTGSLPFASALLWLLHDVGLSWGARLLLRDSFACTLAFIWMSYWKSLASRQILDELASSSPAAIPWSVRASVQTIFQTLKLFVLPLAAVSLFGWSGASAFFRTLALEPSTLERPIRGGLKRALQSATQAYLHNLIAFLSIAALTFVTFLNCLVAYFLTPFLWKLLTGYETEWSRMQGPTLWGVFAVAAATTWLLIDPWIQTYCVLRVFYQNARKDGCDLLRSIARVAALSLVFLLAVSARGNTGQQTLEQSINQVSAGEDYGWLRPQPETAEKGFLADLTHKANTVWNATENRIKRWYRAFSDWLRNRLQAPETPAQYPPGKAVNALELRWLLGILAALIGGAILALFMRRKKTHPEITLPHSAVIADILNEQILPSEVSQEEWLRLAAGYLAQNQTRLAARAFYLANLSYLGSRNLLALSLSKSNKLYERELTRQPRSTELTAAFASANRLYERAWYGMRELASDQMERLQGAAEQIRQHA